MDMDILFGLDAVRARLKHSGTFKQAMPECLGATIKRIAICDNDTLDIEFEDGSTLRLEDQAQSCCEYRYFHTDDDLTYHVGAKLLDAELRVMDDQDTNGGCREALALLITTSKGTFTVVAYNEHNGYYGGFDLRSYFLK